MRLKPLYFFFGFDIQLYFSLGAANGSRIIRKIPLRFRFVNSGHNLVELETRSTFDQLVKGMVVQPVGLVDLALPSDVSI